MGAEVTGVCSTRNLDMLRSLGADHVIDYTQTDWTQSEPRFDLVLDNVGNHPLSRARRPLAADGILLANGAPIGGWFGGLGHFAKAMLASLFVKQQGRPFVSMQNKADLAVLRELAESGRLTPVVDQVYPLDRTPIAIEQVGARHSRGKTVIAM